MTGWKDKFKLRLPALMLLAVTLLFWGWYDRYEPTGPELLEGLTPDAGESVRGDVTFDGGLFRLQVPPGGQRAEIRFPLPPSAAGHDLFRIRCRAKIEGVVEGRYTWDCARLLLVQYDRHMKWVPAKHTVVNITGTADWRRYEDVLDRAPETAALAVILAQSGTAGTVWFDRISVQPVRLRASFLIWQGIFIALWLCMATLYYRRCRLDHRRLRLLILLNVFAILTGTLLPETWIKAGLERTGESVSRLFAAPSAPASVPAKPPPSGREAATKPAPAPTPPEWIHEMESNAHTAGHFSLFASLCFLVYCSAAFERQHPAYFFKVGADILLFAGITESLQFLTLDRSPGWVDLLVDLAGMGLALLAFAVLLPLIRRRQRCLRDLT